jgi:hypothetical protein
VFWGIVYLCSGVPIADKAAGGVVSATLGGIVRNAKLGFAILAPIK